MDITANPFTKSISKYRFICNIYKYKHNKYIMIKNLVLGSGAAAGIAFFGALKVLSEEGYLNFDTIEVYCGCSIGSLICTLIMCGYTVDDLILLTTRMDFKDFLDVKADDAISFFHNYGFDNGTKMKSILSILLKKKNIPQDITLKGFHELTGKKIILSVTNLESKKIEYLHWEKYPDYKLIECLHASMSIPLLYQPVVINNKSYIDGGVIKSFPIEIFRKEKEETFGIGTLCFNRFNDNHNTMDFPCVMSNFKNYILHVFYCAASNSYHIPKDMKYIITDIKGDGLKVDNDTETRLRYVQCGVEQAKKYLESINYSGGSSSSSTE